jgi:predicted nucleotidyltransferase
LPQGAEPGQGDRRDQEDDGGAPGLSTTLEGFDAEAVRQIRARLDLARQSGASILFAIESGSRAWGFPSPDSDYDCRFVYVWPVAQHLVLNVQRDVIEFPIEGEIDAGGWDLRKALLLALKGNAAILEWVKSPYVYEERPGIRSALLAVLDEIVEPALVAKHYLGLLKRHDLAFSDGDIRIKKLFYAIRPALSLHYMEERDFQAHPPMDIGSLLAGVALKQDLADLIAALIETKKITREMGTGPVPSLLAGYLKEALRRYEAGAGAFGLSGKIRSEDRFQAAEAFYRATVMAVSSGQAAVSA